MDRKMHSIDTTGWTKDQIAEAIKELSERIKTAPIASDDIYIWAVIDRSGSMATLINDTINGFNHFLKEQVESKDGNAYLTTVLFDNEHLIINDKTHVKDVQPLNEKTYVPRGSTSLYDAIGQTLSKANSANHKNNIVIILTDGYENSSKEFNHESVKKMITEAEAKGWRFIYLGANQDAFAVSQGLGIVRGQSASFTADSKGVNTAYNTLSSYSLNSRAHYMSELKKTSIAPEDETK